MKRIIVLMLLLPFCFYSCSEEVTIIGHWKIDSVTQDGNTNTDLGNEKSIQFYEDGTLISGRDGEKTPLTGSWVFDEHAETLEMDSGTNNKDDGVYTVNELSTSKMNIEKDKTKISLSRLEESLRDPQE